MTSSTADLIVSRSPQAPAAEVIRVAATAPDRVRAAADAATTAAREWAAMAPAARAGALRAAADAVAGVAAELTDLMVREVGKPRSESGPEVTRCVGILHYYAEQVLDPDGQTYPAATGLLLSRHRPHGVVGLITPWNFPLAIPLWKLAPAVAYGNAVLLKPAPEATALALRLGEVISPALPNGLVQVLPGGARTGQALVECVAAVSFTGSVPAGAAVRMAAARRGIPVQCEMGGQNPSIVFPDADVPAAAAAIANAAMGYAGQKCTATSRVIVVGDPTRFTDALVSAVQALEFGDPANPQVQVGPVITAQARDRVVEAVAKARADGARVLTGGNAAQRAGYFVEPTLVDGVPADHFVAQEEVFGPFCVVLPAADGDEAVRLANGVKYGLAAAVFTSDLARALDTCERLEAGMIKVNAPTSGVDFYAPFGGQKASSYGPREQGKAARDFYTTVHTVTIGSSG